MREKLRRRAYLVWKRTGFKNKIKANLAKHGVRRKFSYSKDGREWLKSLRIEAVDDYLAIIESLNNPIDRIEREIKREAKKDKETEIVMTVPGIGFVWGLTFTTEIGNVNRFSGPEKLCSYAGMIPSTHQSGPMERHGSITKEGNRYLRWAAVECTWSHLKHAEDTKLTRFYGKLARKKGKQVAAVATGRKLLVTLYWMLKRREKFRP
ncbi:hypothetical protein AKJ44_03035 [candidate division MSBL1 archaeon SCGC-AAA261F17]|uniref:Transposase IS116/IS110/IS902 C-terminal domain-containing protein n=1 Tax=candidate division MSBL1 archaeon SCGC-AAA261F17 TaxID=1698274 RepID=A0A133V3K7_9EURY|nr:hypothetical protein AKJ44_03035 [candidate division MSBL1 archaeon SCGC-AAA261F17]